MSTDLTKAAQNVVSLFNSGPAKADYSDLLTVMADNVTIKRVRASESKNSKAVVKDYLNNYMHQRKPSLTVDTPEVWSLQSATGQGELLGYASSSGTYRDDNGRFDGAIDFTLCFTRRRATDDWILANSWAAVK
jgi:hypothetical protein